MAEFCIRAVDKVNPDSADLNRLLFKKGDCVERRPDGWGWTVRELTGPYVFYQLVPEHPELLLPDPDPAVTPPTTGEPVPMIRRRSWFLDIDQLTLAVTAQPGQVTVLTPAQYSAFDAAVKKKPPV